MYFHTPTRFVYQNVMNLHEQFPILYTPLEILFEFVFIGNCSFELHNFM